jgi:hypothetical protein
VLEQEAVCAGAQSTQDVVVRLERREHDDLGLAVTGAVARLLRGCPTRAYGCPSARRRVVLGDRVREFAAVSGNAVTGIKSRRKDCEAPNSVAFELWDLGTEGVL